MKMYTVAKSFFLILNAALLPLAILYLLLHQAMLASPLFILIGVYFLVPFWLVYFVGMGLYHFPLKTGAALKEVGLLFISLVVFSMISGGNWLFGFYSTFYFSLVGFAVFIFSYLRRGIFWLGLLIFVLFFVYGLSGPLLAEIFSLENFLAKALAGAIAVAQIGNAAWEHGQARKMVEPQEKEAKEKEWNRWTGACAAGLILSLCVTLFMLMLASPTSKAYLGNLFGND